MIRLLIHKELRELMRTTKLVWLLAGITVLMALALYNGYAYYVAHSRLLRESQRITYQQFITQGDKNPHLGAHFGFYAYKPTADLAMIENGVEDYTGNSFYLEPHKRGIVRFKEVADATGLRSFGFLNIGYFAQFILPLFIFLICHNSFTKEWENGTIKLLLSTRLSARQLFLGKLAAGGLIVLAFVALIAAGTLVMLLTEHESAQWGGLLPIWGSYMAGLILFAGLMTVIGVSVSLLTRRSAYALVVLASFWLLGVFLVPRLAGEMARNTYPAMTSLAFENQTFREKEYGVGAEGTKDYRRAQLKERVLNQYGVTRLEDLPVFFIPITIEYFEESDGKVMDRAYQAIERNEERQNQLVLWSAWLSPFLAFRDFSMRVTATDMATHYDFAENAERHRRKMGAVVDDFYQKNTVATNDFWKTVPQFAYQPPPLRWRLANAGWSILVLLGWCVGAGLLMVYSYRTLTV